MRRDKDYRVVVASRMGGKLRDGSTLKKVHRVWSTVGLWNDTNRVELIEATTSND